MLVVVAVLSFVIGVPAFLAGALSFGRLWAWGRRKGYTGPAVPAMLMLLSLASLGGCITLLVVAGERYLSTLLIPPLAFATLLVALLLAFVIAAAVLFVLPQREHRPAGQRKTRLPFRIAGHVALAATVVLPVAVLIAGLPVNTALRLPLVTLPVAVGCFVAANRKDKPERDRKLREDPRPPVLYMRGFAEERRLFARRAPGPHEVYAGPFLDQMHHADLRYATFEEYLEPTVRTKLGPWRGLGNPTDYLPRRGVSRVYSNDRDWRDEFRDWVRRSSCILTSPGVWQYLVWELHAIKSLDCQHKLFVLTPPPTNKWTRRMISVANWSIGTGLTDWHTFASAAAQQDPHEKMLAGFDFGDDPGPGAVVAFDGEARGVVLTRNARSPGEYVQAVGDHLRRA